MDVAMLKEIDLVAFGRRVRVYNAIKELRHRTQPGNLMSSMSTTGIPVSPSLSGYGPEAPAALAYSPMTGVYAPSGTATQQPRWDPSQEPTKPSNEPLAGLGLQDEVLVGDRALPVRPAFSSQREWTADFTFDRRLDGSQGSSVGNAQENGLRSSQTSAESPRVQSEATPAAPNEAESSPTSRPLKNQSRLSSAASSLRPRSSGRGRTSDGNDEGTLQESRKPDVVATEGRRESKSDKSGFSMPTLPAVGRNRKPPPRVPS